MFKTFRISRFFKCVIFPLALQRKLIYIDIKTAPIHFNAGGKMENKNFTPEESLLLISKTIEETKQSFKDNGHLIILWGVLTFTVFFLQYFFQLIGWHNKFDIIWTTVLFPLGGIYTFIYTRKTVKEKNVPKTLLLRVIQTMGWAMGMNLLVLGMVFSGHLGDAMAPVFIILFALAMVVIGASIRFKPIFFGGVLLNLIGYGTFWLARDYHGFSMMLAAVVGFIIPGILLNRAKRRDHV